MNSTIKSSQMDLSGDPAEKIIVALDGMAIKEVDELISNLPGLKWVKVGLELFLIAGPEVLFALREKGLRVFLDLKFHDIPVTMARACHQAASTGAELITVHACAGTKALFEAQRAANEGASNAGFPPPTLLAVTVLTSWEDKSFVSQLSINQSIDERVERLAELAVEAGLGGCVCSPLEVKRLRKIYKSPFELVTPGIRPLGDEYADQERVMTPVAATLAGASRLVIGRPITQSSKPQEAFRRCCQELSSAFYSD